MTTHQDREHLNDPEFAKDFALFWDNEIVPQFGKPRQEAQEWFKTVMPQRAAEMKAASAARRRPVVTQAQLDVMSDEERAALSAAVAEVTAAAQAVDDTVRKYGG